MNMLFGLKYLLVNFLKQENRNSMFCANILVTYAKNGVWKNIFAVCVFVCLCVYIYNLSGDKIVDIKLKYIHIIMIKYATSCSSSILNIITHHSYYWHIPKYLQLLQEHFGPDQDFINSLKVERFSQFLMLPGSLFQILGPRLLSVYEPYFIEF